MLFAKSINLGINDLEVVERKGVGHPDSLCDGVAEHFANTLCDNYERDYGMIQPFNVKEVSLTAGESKPEWGGGEVIYAAEFFLTADATTCSMEINDMAYDAMKDYIIETIPSFDVNRMSACIEDKQPFWDGLAYGTGHAGYTKLEEMVLKLEEEIIPAYSDPAIGQDITIIGSKYKDDLEFDLTVCFCDEYLSSKHELNNTVFNLKAHLEKTLPAKYKIHPILTTMGTRAENGLDGFLGRGNGPNGLITPMKPQLVGGISGKGPDHAVRAYSMTARTIATRIVEETTSLEANVFIMNEYGKQLNMPKYLMIEVVGNQLDEAKAIAQNVLDDEVDDLRTF